MENDIRTDKSALVSNIESVLALDEPNPSHWASLLAYRMGVSRQTGWRILNHGTESLRTLQQIADALGLSASALIDPALVGKRALRARITVDGAEYACVAWVDSEPTVPWNADTLVARCQNGCWRVGRFASGSRAPAQVVRYYEGQPEPLSKSQCTIAILAESDLPAIESIAASLSAYGFSPLIAHDTASLLAQARSLAPDALLIQSSQPRRMALALSAELGRAIPAIILLDEQQLDIPPDPLRGFFYARKNVFDVMMALRTFVSFTPRAQPPQPAPALRRASPEHLDSRIVA
ncbi:MAG: hypothetical protein JO142_09275 [Burkholderiales bacterium]|nr:hypothetical protein [Burkholderiales bacterium]